MSQPITLFWCPSTRAARALWMIEELAIPYELVKIDLRDEESRSNADFQAATRGCTQRHKTTLNDTKRGTSTALSRGLMYAEYR